MNFVGVVKTIDQSRDFAPKYIWWLKKSATGEFSKMMMPVGGRFRVGDRLEVPLGCVARVGFFMGASDVINECGLAEVASDNRLTHIPRPPVLPPPPKKYTRVIATEITDPPTETDTG